MRISDWSSDVCSSDLPLAAAGQFGRYARTSGMNFGADMMRDEADDAFAIGGAQPGAAIRDALAEPVDPEAAVRIEHDLDDLRVEIGRASCRERVGQYGYISVVAVSLKKKKNKK